MVDEQPTAEAAETTETTETTEVTETKEAEVEGEKKSEETAETEEPDASDIIKALPSRKKTAQERIAELTWKIREGERKAEALERKLAEPEAAPARPTDTGRPKLENFDSTEAYEDALLDWKLKDVSRKSEEDRQKERDAEALRKFNEKADKIRTEYDDFDEVVQAPVFTKVMRTTLLSSENGPHLAYYLGRPENLKVAEKIASLPAELQPYEIGRLETKLMLAQKTKKVPGAPPPINPIGGTGTSAVDESKMDDDEWFKLEKQRNLEKLKKKYGG